MQSCGGSETELRLELFPAFSYALKPGEIAEMTRSSCAKGELDPKIDVPKFEEEAPRVLAQIGRSLLRPETVSRDPAMGPAVYTFLIKIRIDKHRWDQFRIVLDKLLAKQGFHELNLQQGRTEGNGIVGRLTIKWAGWQRGAGEADFIRGTSNSDDPEHWLEEVDRRKFLGMKP
jgi:hypothetical protein